MWNMVWRSRLYLYIHWEYWLCRWNHRFDRFTLLSDASDQSYESKGIRKLVRNEELIDIIYTFIKKCNL